MNNKSSILWDEQCKIRIRETEELNQLIKLKKVGDTYSDVIRRLLRKNGK